MSKTITIPPDALKVLATFPTDIIKRHLEGRRKYHTFKCGEEVYVFKRNDLRDWLKEYLSLEPVE